jgi:outer membrane lipoprotein LolB
MKAIFFTVAIVFATLITGCASFYNVNPSGATKYTKPILIDNDFDISGRFYIKSLDKTSYGNFSWLKIGNHEEFDFNTPLGQTVAKIIIESSGITLYNGNKVYSGTDLNTIMQNNFGFVLPINYLHYWVAGVALPNTPIDQQIADGFIQLGWTVEYLEWYNRNHPKIIKISRNNLQIKLFIEW